MNEKNNKTTISPIRAGGMIMAGVVSNDRELENQNDVNIIESRDYKGFNWIEAFKLYKKQGNHSFLKNRYITTVFIILLIILSFNSVVSSNINLIPYPFSTNVNNQSESSPIVLPGGAIYNSKSLINGSTINFQVNATNPISFAIWNGSVKNLPHSNAKYTTTQISTFNVSAESDRDYFLFKGDSIHYVLTFNSVNIAFYIFNKTEYNSYINGGYPTNAFETNTITLNGVTTGSFTAPVTGEYYLVWSNTELGVNDKVNSNIEFTYSVPNFKKSAFSIENTTIIPSTTFKVQKPGNYIEFVYSYHNSSYALTTPLKYSLSINEKFSAVQEWQMNLPMLNIFTFVLELIIIGLFINEIRNNYKKVLKDIDSEKKEESSNQENHLHNNARIDGKCPNCGSDIYNTDSFCAACGFKISTEPKN